MPYNTTAIPPRKGATGQTQLPLSRVKKIVSQDPDVNICSNNAAFIITVATELFVQRLATEALKQAKLEKKPRRNIQYKDVANAVHYAPELEFLVDVVPKVVKYKEIKAKAAAQRALVRGERVDDAAKSNSTLVRDDTRDADDDDTTAGASASPAAAANARHDSRSSSNSRKKHKGNAVSRGSLNGNSDISIMMAAGNGNASKNESESGNGSGRRRTGTSVGDDSMVVDSGGQELTTVEQGEEKDSSDDNGDVEMGDVMQE